MNESIKRLIRALIAEEVERFVQSMAGSSGGANLGASSANNQIMLGDEENTLDDEFVSTIGDNESGKLTTNGPKR